VKLIDDLPDLYARWDEIYEEGKSLTKVSGVLAVEAAELPAHIGYYGEVWKEIHNIKRRVDSEVKKKRGELFRFYSTEYGKALSSRDVEQYINSDKEFYELSQNLHDVSYWEGKFDALLQGFSSKNWMIGHITKLELAGMDGIEI